MGKPIASQASGAPSSGDQAMDVVTGTLTAAQQVSSPYVFWGPFNIAMYLTVSMTLTTAPVAATGALNAGVAAGATAPAGVAGSGQSLNSTALIAGAYLASFSTSGTGTLTSVQIGGLTTSQVATLVATQAVAIMQGPATPGDATVVLEKSYDAGNTWLSVTNSAGTALSWHLAVANINNPVAFTMLEVEKGVAYRLRCSAYSSGTVTYRLSDGAPASSAWGFNTSV